MLDKLFGSKARVKILKIFLLHSGKKFYIRQLARDLKLQVNSVRRELDNLEQFGLLVSKMGTEDDGDELQEELEALEKLKEGKLVEKKVKKTDSSTKQEKKYFQTNSKFILFEELKNLIVKAQLLYEKDFVEKISKLGNLKLVILTGFFVNIKNPVTDILVVGSVNKIKLNKIIKDLEKDLGREVNYTLLSGAEFTHRRDMTDIFLYDILEGEKIVVVDNIKLEN
jgi:DNA-binding transcriptional regulator YhcF (GntR family)